ncbi:restriction endonuclease subunit S [Flavobacterium sp. FlaQc-48]|uniref:restriction endonuclease subunit S n=1 Tax=Flavobacterium sp. FlaQc-48 TaxID=3374181 RepID=UPI0037567E63
MKLEKLNKIFSIQKGGQNKLTDNVGINSVRVIQIDDLRNDTNIKYSNDSKGLLATEEDILIAWDGANVGTVGYGKKGYIGSTLARLKIKDDNNYDYRYLGLFIKSKSSYLKKKSTGATIPHINKNSLENLLIPIPGKLVEQIRIAEILTKIENLIEQRKESISLLNDFLKNTFYDTFGDPLKNDKKWSKEPLTKFGTVITGNTPPRSDLNNYSNNYIEWIKTDNISNKKTFISKSKEYLSKEGLSKSRSVDKGALLVACIAGSIESLGRASLTDRKVSFNQQINAIQPNDEINSYFLYWLFRTSKVYIENHSTKGMKKILTKGRFEKILMIKPPIDIQNEFGLIVLKAENIKEKFEESLNELENLFSSLSHLAFKGDLNLNKLDIGTKAIEIEEKFKTKNSLELELISKPMEEFIKQTREIQKRVSVSTEILPKSLLKQIETTNKSISPFQKLPVIPEELAQAMKTFENIISITSKLNQDAEKQYDGKFNWQEVNFEMVAKWIKEQYSDYHFNSELLVNFLINEKVIFPNYHSSEELKTNPKLVESDDLKSFIFSALNNDNQFIKLEQFFYNGEKENVELKLRIEDYQIINSKGKKITSGIYFKIKE